MKLSMFRHNEHMNVIILNDQAFQGKQSPYDILSTI